MCIRDSSYAVSFHQNVEVRSHSVDCMFPGSSKDYVVNNKTINPIDIKVEEWPAYMEYNNLEEVFRRKEKEALLRGVGLAEQVGSSTEIIVAAALGGPKWWVMDSGSSKDLVSVEFLPKEVVITPADDPAALSTANGPVIADEEAELKLEMLEEDIKPLIMEHAPPILSMGERIMDRHCCNLSLIHISEPTRPY